MSDSVPPSGVGEDGGPRGSGYRRGGSGCSPTRNSSLFSLEMPWTFMYYT